MTLRFPGRGRRFGLALAVAVLGVASVATPAAAVSITLRTTASGLSHPVYVTHAGDSRLFIVEQAGRIRVRQSNGSISTFLDIRTRVGYDGGERGLFSIAFHPDYRDPARWGRQRFYVNYIDRTSSHNIVLSEFRTSSTNPNVASASTERVLLRIPHATYSNHNGGLVAFGPDKRLYLSTGDGGGGGDPLNNAQNKDSLLGKLLRISPIDADPTSGPNYGVPTDNPFYGGIAGRDEIWQYGLRNPWRYSFDHATGDLWIGDVGQNNWEEVDFASNAGGLGRGWNWGWDVMEGNHCYPPSVSTCNTAGKQRPLLEYATHVSGRCTVIGGYRYRGPTSSLTGRYLFADFCSGEIWYYNSMAPGRKVLLLNTSLMFTSFGEAMNGYVYVTATNGAVYRIAPS
jgi:glucose/arabinose dehydrogenase